MRIALLTGEYPPQPGGVGDYTRQLGLALCDEGHQVAVITVQEGQLRRYDLPDGGAVDVSASGPLTWSPRILPHLRAAIETWQPDWLHIQYQTGAYAMRVGVNMLPRYLRRAPRRPRVAVTFHDVLEPYLFPKAGPLRTWVNRRLAVDADAVVATNAADAAGLAAFGLRGRALTTIPIGSNIHVAPPTGYDRTAWRAALGVAPGEVLVAYFGLLSPSKGADLLVEALASQGPAMPWRLLLIGGAATAPQDAAFAASLQAQIDKLGVGARVIRTGHVDAAAVSAHLLSADCAALPFRDGASFRRGSLLATLAHGCPTITTVPADHATAAALGDDRVALLIPPNDSLALSAALAHIAAAPALRASLAAAGRLAALSFAWPEIARRHTELYAA